MHRRNPPAIETELATGHADAPEEVQPAYEPPHLTVLGTLADLTRGSDSAANTDGVFPGSLFT